MKSTDFITWMEAFNRMSRDQRDTLREQLQGKVTGDEGVKLIEQSLADVSACLHCGGTELYRWGNSCDLQRYRCRNCQPTFSALTHTPLMRLLHKVNWLNYERAMVQVLSIRQTAARCENEWYR